MSPQRASRSCAKCQAPATHGRYCEKHKAVAVEENQARRDKLPYRHDSKAWLQTKEECRYRYGGQCAQLDEHGNRCPLMGAEAHHIVKATEYVARGGGYLDQQNLVLLCKACHSRHTVAERTGNAVRGSFAPPDNTEFSPAI
jgi:5-methylcytosine-specific restriction endonuclease McrA